MTRERPGIFPSSLPDDVLATGGIAGDGSLDQLIAHAQATGRAAARRAARVRREWQSAVPTRGPVNGALLAGDPSLADDGDPVAIPELPVDEHPELFRARTHGIVDYCEDVSSKDLIAAVREGYDSIELAKRYTTATMGPTQGKIELVNAIAVVAEATGRTIAETGTTTWRPPYAPVTLGALAGLAARARPVLPDAAVARGAPREPADRRGLDQARSLRRPGRRGQERAEQGRHHRRHPDRQARPARSRRTAAAQPGVRQQVVQARHRPGQVRRHVHRGRRGLRRRRHRAPRP